MNKTVSRAIGIMVGVLIVASAVLFSSPGNARRGSWEIEISSPDGKYRVSLSGKEEKPVVSDYPHGDHRVTYTVLKNGRLFLNKVGLYGGDQYDDLFLDLYPTREWVSGTTLRFGGKLLPAYGLDRIVVKNKNPSTIECLRINFGVSDIFLIFDLSPGESIELSADPQTDRKSDISGILCFAQLAGREIEKRTEFNIIDRYNGPATYYVAVEDSGFVITSDQFEPTSETSGE